MTKGQTFETEGKWKLEHCSLLMSAWCDLISKGDISKLHDRYTASKFNCQKQVTLTLDIFILTAVDSKAN